MIASASAVEALFGSGVSAAAIRRADSRQIPSLLARDSVFVQTPASLASSSIVRRLWTPLLRESNRIEPDQAVHLTPAFPM